MSLESVVPSTLVSAPVESALPNPTVPSGEIEVVYFDLGNVLLDFDHGIACRGLASLFETTETRIRDEVFASGLEDRYESGDIDTPSFHAILCEKFGVAPALADVCTAASDIFRMRHDTVSILAQLKGAGMRTGILSNTCEAHWKFVTDGRYRFLLDLVDHVVLSYEVKAMKPSLVIYAAAAEIAGTIPERIFFMDDRPENVAGARAARIHAYLFIGGAQLAEDLRRCGVRFNY